MADGEQLTAAAVAVDTGGTAVQRSAVQCSALHCGNFLPLAIVQSPLSIVSHPATEQNSISWWVITHTALHRRTTLSQFCMLYTVQSVYIQCTVYSRRPLRHSRLPQKYSSILAKLGGWSDTAGV